MIDDIIFEYNTILFELEPGEPGGIIIAYSMDSENMDIKQMEVSGVFIF